MIKRTIILAFVLLLPLVVFCQQETVGFGYNQHDRSLDSFKTNSGLWYMSYRYNLPSNTRLAATLGLDNTKLFDKDNTDTPVLKSKNQVFVGIELQQVLSYFYIKGAVQYYTINGNAYEAPSSQSVIKYKNYYKLFEFPLGVGITVPTEYVDIYLGANKTYFYGSNKKDIVVNNGGTETDLGSSPKTTFKTELKFAAEGSLVFHVSREINIELSALKYAGKDFSIGLSLWGPLKRMYNTN